MRTRVLAILVGVTALAVAGCAAEPPDQVETSVQPAAATPSAPTEATPSAEPSPTSTTDPGGCELRTGLGFLQGGDEHGHWVYWVDPVPALVDRGPRESARGTVATDADGRLVSYTVAEGDGELAIGDRFCIVVHPFVRYSGLGQTLHAGDVLRLSVPPEDLFEPKQR